MKSRAYRSGSSWAFWRWTELDSAHLTRLFIVKSPWFAVCLHWLNAPDPEPYEHDHPVTFLSIILRGGYSEIRNGILRRHGWFNFIRATTEDTHRIVSVLPQTLTLALMGPKTREWGFHRPNGWVGWKDYYTENRV